jgi:putative transposase
MSRALAQRSNARLRVVGAEDGAPTLTGAQLQKQQALVLVMRYVRNIRGELGTDSLRPACAEFERQFNARLLPTAVLGALMTLRPTKAGSCPDRATLYRWDERYTRFLQGGNTAAAPKHQGRQRTVYGWEARAIHLWQQPTKPAMSTVAYWLRGENFDSATDSRVRRYLKSLPATLGEQSAQRMGRHFYQQNLRPYVLRDDTVLPVGLIYQGDGHNCDVYVAHPNTGKPWRPEFTPWIDVRSHYVVGWYLSEAESSLTTLFSLSHALAHHDHVCALIHVDPGSGFKNRMMTDEVSGYLARMSIEFMSALPGNAKGKGLVEGFFHIFEERLGKTFPTFCGHNRSDDYLRHLSQKVKRGQIVLPTLAEYRDAIAAYIERYNNTYQERLGCTPAELWAQLERTPLETAEAAIIRPRELRKVQRWGVTLHNRMYRHAELAHYNGREVMVEYDLHNDATVTIRDHQARFICEAEQVDRKPWLPASRIEELQQNRVDGQRKRLQQKLDEVQARGRAAITHDAVLEDIELLCDTPALGHAPDGPSTPSPRSLPDPADLDILDTDY